MEAINDLILFLLPIIILQWGLMIYALVKAIKQQEFKYFSKTVWIILIVLTNLIGPVTYLILEGENN